MNISFVTTYDAQDIHNWSGTPFYIADSLKKQGANIEYVGNLDFPYEDILKVKQLFYRMVNKRYLRNREPLVARSYAEQAQGRLSPQSDIIFGPDSIPFAYLKSDKPKVIYTDATFAAMIDYYGAFTNLCQETIRKGHALEKRALDNCQLLIYSSEWAAQSAINFYGVSPEKVKVVPLGANLMNQRTVEDIHKIIEQKPKGVCNLLLLGVDWERKGGNLVVQIAQKLIDRGLDARVNVVGIKELSRMKLPPFVKSHGFISKATQEGRERIERLISESHFLVVPSKAEAFGVVFCEASSFGLPSLSTKTGGITTVIQDNVNGCTFTMDADPEQYAEFIIEKMGNASVYKEFALSTFEDYTSRLSWEASGKAVISHLKNLL